MNAARRPRRPRRRGPGRLGPGDYLGAATLFAAANQALTGVLLAMFYRPTVGGAYASVRSIQSLPLGRLLRSLHYWGAGAMIVLLLLHAGRVYYVAAYRPPRRATWVAGGVLAALVAALAFTGYLLPWDQHGYWATMVGTAMLRYLPLAGGATARWLRGGADLSGLTLTRFYALHALVLPALLAAAAGVHVALVYTHGLAGRAPEGPRAGPAPVRGRRRFWPVTAAGVTGACACVAAALLILAAVAPAPLAGPADPLNRAGYQPVPPWYFLGFYQFLKYLPGRLDAVGIAGVPAALALLVLGLPFYDRGMERRPSRRPFALAAGGALMAGLIGLTYLGWRSARPALATEVPRHPRYAVDIAPLLRAECLPCHAGADAAGGLDLTSHSALMRRGVVTPGDPHTSLLVLVLQGRAPGVAAMPLGRPPLPPGRIRTIENWIADGARP